MQRILLLFMQLPPGKYMNYYLPVMVGVCLSFLAFPATAGEYQASSPVSGTVTDSETGDGLPGVSVLVQGTASGTITDINGSYNIDVGDANVMVFSYVGFETQEVSVNGRSVIDVAISSSLVQLSELVVVGYGSQEKSDITGAITSVSGADLNITKENSPLGALAGKAAGVDISFSDNTPGGNTDIRIRGRSSLNFSNAPLIVLDGIPLSGVGSDVNGDGIPEDGVNLNDINPNDIASVEVLKDASSTAIYGARGANGIILITTKRGKAGKARITYDSYYGFSQPFKQIDLTNAKEWIDMRLESLRAAAEQDASLAVGDYPIFPLDSLKQPLRRQAFDDGVDTNFQDILLDNGMQQSHQIGISGGSDAVRYFVSLGYFDQEGILEGTDYQRYTLRTNLDYKVNSKLKMGISQQISFSERHQLQTGSGRLGSPGSTSTVAFLFRNNPLTTPFNPDGTPTTDPLNDGLIWNPINDLDNVQDLTKDFRYFANIFATYEIIDGLSYTLNVGPDLTFSRRNQFFGSNSTVNRGGLPNANKQDFTSGSLTLENVVNYTKSFNNDHSFNVTLLGSVQNVEGERFVSQVSDLALESQTFNNLGDAAKVIITDSDLIPESWVSYMARVNYDINSKYLFTLTGRIDGSSKLSTGEKWGVFPSAAFAWRLIEEPFINDLGMFTDLKLRTSFGSVGRNPIAPFSSQGGLVRTEYSFSDGAAFGFRPLDIPNSDLSWERTTTLDVGLDFGVANNRVSGTMDFYVGNTTDLLLARALPITSGFSSILQNVGETKNTGFELVLSTVNIDVNGLKWTTDFNFSTNRSEIVSLFDSKDDDIGNKWFIGQQVAVHYDNVFDGIWQSNERDEAAGFFRKPGDIKLKDLTNDGVLNDEDRKIVGQLDPKWIGGIISRLEYKGIDLTVSLYTRQGHTLRSALINRNNTLFGRYNNIDINYWTPENPSNEYPRPNANQERPLDSDVLDYVDASFWRIRNITLGYNFNEAITSALKVESLRVYATAQNPFLFTSSNLDGFDPDVAGFDGRIVTGGNQNYLPSPKTFLFGLNVAF